MKKKVTLDFDNYVGLFKALADKNRITLLGKIFNCTQEDQTTNVNNISSCCSIDLSVVSRHLSVLKKAGILNSQKLGKEVFYSINAKELARRLREMADFLECCEPKKKGEIK